MLIIRICSEIERIYIYILTLSKFRVGNTCVYAGVCSLVVCRCHCVRVFICGMQCIRNYVRKCAMLAYMCVCVCGSQVLRRMRYTSV